MSVKLKSIEVVELFSYLSYKIDNLNSNQITYLIGKNGLGKTTILNLIRAVSHQEWDAVRDADFKKLSIIVEADGKTYYIVFTKNETESKILWNISETPNEKISFNLPVGYWALSRFSDKAQWIGEHNTKVSKATCGRHWMINGRQHLDDVELVKQLEVEVPKPGGETLDIKSFSFLEEWRTSLIEANRFSIFKSHNKTHRINQKQPITINTLSEMLKQESLQHLAHAMQSNLKLNANYLQELFSTDTSETDITIDSLKKQLKSIEDTEKKLEKIADFKIEYVAIPDELDTGLIHIVSKYLNHREKQLAPHKAFIERLELFAELINSAVTSKTLNAGTDGLTVHSVKNKELKLDQLSSGEQHLITLAYALIFFIEKDTYVLIDEPELSMHLEWQEAFSDLLQQIGKNRKLTFLCATHSPSIIDERVSQMRSINPNPL